MSLEAISWALTQAPDVPPECVSLLVGLANHADSLGRGAYAGQKLLASYARKTDRSARNDLAKLLSIGLIRHGDQKLAAHIPADCRPVVYDLALERKHASGRKQDSARQSASAATTDRFTEPQAPDQQERGGDGSTLPGGNEVPGGNERPRERKPASYKPTTNPNQNSPTESSNSGGPGGSATSSTLFGADVTPAKPRRSRAAKPAEHPRFAEWYAAYPVHKARADAVAAYSEAVRDGADPETLLAAAVSYQRDDYVLRNYGKHPATWLRKQCWLDDITPARAAANGQRSGHQPYRNPDDQSDYDLGFTDGR